MLYGLQTACGYFDLVTSHKYPYTCTCTHTVNTKKGGLGRGWMWVAIRGMCVGS